MKENDDYIYRCDLAERLGYQPITISRAAEKIGLKVRSKTREKYPERYFLIDEALLITSKLKKSETLPEPPKRGSNIYGSYQRVWTW